MADMIMPQQNLSGKVVKLRLSEMNEVIQTMSEITVDDIPRKNRPPPLDGNAAESFVSHPNLTRKIIC